jgi:6-phosphofructokinase 1
VAIQRIGDHSSDCALVELAKVGGRTKVMADAFIAPSGSDVTPAFRAYLRPLLGSDLPQPARLRGGTIAKVLKR